MYTPSFFYKQQTFWCDRSGHNIIILVKALNCLILAIFEAFSCLFHRRVATCAIFRRKVRYVRSIYGVRWSALKVRSICCVSIKYEFLFDKSRQISINIM